MENHTSFAPIRLSSLKQGHMTFYTFKVYCSILGDHIEQINNYWAPSPGNREETWHNMHNRQISLLDNDLDR